MLYSLGISALSFYAGYRIRGYKKGYSEEKDIQQKKRKSTKPSVSSDYQSAPSVISPSKRDSLSLEDM